MARAKQPVSINGLEFDALINENQGYQSTVPEYSVEDGYMVTDSIILSPESLSMTLFVTDTPVTWASQHSPYIGRAANIVQQLKDIYYSRTTVTIITTDATYVSMAIKSIELSKTLELGTSREIPITFGKINVTKTETTTIPDSYGKSGSSLTATGTTGTASGSSGTSGSSGSSSSSGSSGASGSSSSGKANKSSILYGAAKSCGLI